MNRQQKLVLFASILASFVAFLDGSVVNVALPAIEHDLGGGLPMQQWIVNAYLLTLGSFILVAGSLSDLFGRKRVITVGLFGFGLTSLICAIAPNSQILIGARALQGLFGALLVPSSLALIISSFRGAMQGKAIGIWTAWTGMAFIIGPLVGGVLVDQLTWQWVFVINVPPILLTLLLLRKIVERSRLQENTKLDVAGAVLCSMGLGSIVYALIEQTNRGIADPLIVATFLGGIALFVWFIRHEQRTAHPMLPLGLFKIQNFAVGNIATTAIYAGLSLATFLIVIFVQQIGGYSALNAGLSLLPVTLIMFFLSSRFGGLAGKYGPRLFMAIGPVIAAFGFLLMLSVDERVLYWQQLFPGIIVFGIGLSITVAPLTSAILADIQEKNAGIGSAINNAVARVAGLLATAAVGLIVSSNLSVLGFHRGIVATAILLSIGGIVSAIGIHNKRA